MTKVYPCFLLKTYVFVKYEYYILRIEKIYRYSVILNTIKSNY